MIRAIGALCLVLLAGCASTTPGARLDREAERRGLAVRTLAVEASTGERFHLRAYVRDGEPSDTLHVYLEGDGAPWIGGTHVADDPHGRRVLAFELMLRDPAPAVYLERPCYHRLDDRDPCRPELWTTGRYSETVVSSLAAAIRQLHAERGEPSLTLVGYSGGGVLAAQLVRQLPDDRLATRLITVAANLDLAAWTGHHGYLPLAASIDPAVGDAPAVDQLHLLGADDTVVPPSLVVPLLERWDVPYRVRDGFGHVCCWIDAWPEILARLDG